MQDLLIIRHGESEWNLEHRWQGWKNAPLTTLGETQVFRHDFAMQEAAYQAARAFTYEVYQDAQDTVLRGDPLSAAQRQRIRQRVSSNQRLIVVGRNACHYRRWRFSGLGISGATGQNHRSDVST